MSKTGTLNHVHGCICIGVLDSERRLQAVYFAATEETLFSSLASAEVNLSELSSLLLMLRL